MRFPASLSSAPIAVTQGPGVFVCRCRKLEGRWVRGFASAVKEQGQIAKFMENSEARVAGAKANGHDLPVELA